MGRATAPRRKERVCPVVLGRASARQRDVHELVRRAQAAGLDRLRAGVPVAEVDRACRDTIAEAGPAEAFGHPTGHGVGLELHEAPGCDRPPPDGSPPGRR
jgi:Xaa-Pro aminopeptidase